MAFTLGASSLEGHLISSLMPVPKDREHFDFLRHLKEIGEKKMFVYDYVFCHDCEYKKDENAAGYICGYGDGKTIIFKEPGKEPACKRNGGALHPKQIYLSLYNLSHTLVPCQFCGFCGGYYAKKHIYFCGGEKVKKKFAHSEP
jgi:hypothetical protein